MKVVQTEKSKKSLLLRIAIAALLIYSVIAIVNQQINISQKDQQMTDYPFRSVSERSVIPAAPDISMTAVLPASRMP